MPLRGVWFPQGLSIVKNCLVADPSAAEEVHRGHLNEKIIPWKMRKDTLQATRESRLEWEIRASEVEAAHRSHIENHPTMLG